MCRIPPPVIIATLQLSEVPCSKAECNKQLLSKPPSDLYKQSAWKGMHYSAQPAEELLQIGTGLLIFLSNQPVSECVMHCAPHHFRGFD